MRISDWSSDVCSSDLAARNIRHCEERSDEAISRHLPCASSQPPPKPLPMRIAFMGTPPFAVPTLAALHAAGHRIAAVYTQPPRPAQRGKKVQQSAVHDWADAHGLPVRKIGRAHV